MKHTPHREESGSGTLSALVVGFIVGAAAVVFSKPENRTKLQKKVNKFWEMGEDKVEEMSDALHELKDQGRKRLSQEVDRVQDRLEDTAENVKSKAKSVK